MLALSWMTSARRLMVRCRGQRGVTPFGFPFTCSFVPEPPEHVTPPSPLPGATLPTGTAPKALPPVLPPLPISKALGAPCRGEPDLPTAPHLPPAPPAPAWWSSTEIKGPRAEHPSHGKHPRIAAPAASPSSAGSRHPAWRGDGSPKIRKINK